jgi:hypothetical protein
LGRCLAFRLLATKEKVLRASAAICFNKTYRARQLTPKYKNMKVNGYSREATHKDGGKKAEGQATAEQ